MLSLQALAAAIALTVFAGCCDDHKPIPTKAQQETDYTVTILNVRKDGDCENWTMMENAYGYRFGRCEYLGVAGDTFKYLWSGK